MRGRAMILRPVTQRPPLSRDGSGMGWKMQIAISAETER